MINADIHHAWPFPGSNVPIYNINTCDPVRYCILRGEFKLHGPRCNADAAALKSRDHSIASYNVLSSYVVSLSLHPPSKQKFYRQDPKSSRLQSDHPIRHISSSRAPSSFTMASPPPVIFILGAGPRVGSSVARKFTAQGFSVAVASRSVTDGSISTEGYLQLCVDLSQPASVPAAFKSIKTRLGAPPSVVVYNGTPLPPPSKPLSTPSSSTHPFQAPSANPTHPPTPSPSP